MRRQTHWLVFWWCAGGALLGSLFPVAGWLWASEGDLGTHAIMEAHRVQPVLTIVASAPLVLALAGAVAGTFHRRVHMAFRRCEQTVRERTAELQSANNRLVELMHAKDRFVNTIGHELRTPITAVVGFAGCLESAWEQGDPGELAELVSLISTQASEVSGILEDLLVASRADLTGLSIASQELDLGNIALECVRALGHTPEFVANLVVDAHPATVTADAGRVRQIVRNLLTNAERYGGRHVRIQSGSRDQRGFVRVCDDGDGVPAADAAIIFEPFTHSEGTAVASGSVGIGLSVSRTLARLMGGEIEYRRESGWTVFELSLPLEYTTVA